MRELPLFLTLIVALSAGASAAKASDSQGQPPATPKANAPPAPITRNAPRAAPDGGLGMALLGARVNAAGGLVTSVGAVSSRSFTSVGFTGRYEVIFNRDVTGCIYSAAPFDVNAGTMVALQPRSFEPNGVFLIFFNDAGVAKEVEFYITVLCGR